MYDHHEVELVECSTDESIELSNAGAHDLPRDGLNLPGGKTNHSQCFISSDVSSIRNDIFLAARSGDFHCVLDLLEQNSEQIISLRDNDGYSILHWAALNGDVSACLQLLTHGAHVNVLAMNHQTPIMWACLKGHVAVVNALYTRGADLLQKDSLGANSLILATQHRQTDRVVHWAAYFGHQLLLTFLSYFEVNFSLQDRDGMTPLHRAAASGHVDVCKWLVRHGSDPTVLNYKQQDFLSVAENKCSSNVFKRMSLIPSQFSKVETKTQLSLLQELAGFVFFIGFTMCMIAHFVYVRPNIESGDFFGTMLLAQEFFSFLVFGLHVYMMNSDAGLIPRKYKGNGTIVEQIQHSLVDIKDRCERLPELERICPTCWLSRPIRSKHCGICDGCFDDFDHHCLFIRNCVGYGNRRIFMMYIFTLPIALALHGFLLVSAFQNYVQQVGVVGFLWCLFTFFVSWPLAIPGCGIVLIFVPSLSLLVTAQVRSILYNLSTNEMMNLHRYSHFWKAETSQVRENGMIVVDQKFKNPFDKGPCRNWIDFWANRRNRYA
eukprot:gene573-463_t